MRYAELVVWDKDRVSGDREAVGLIGGKASGLHCLRGAGIPVPAWATLTTKLFRAVCEQDRNFRETIAKDFQDPKEKASFLRALLQKIAIPNRENNLILEVWRRISENGRTPVAVRSSAADEDGGTLSFAGQMDTFLNVGDQDRFLDAVRSCWASLFGERAVLYRLQNGLDPWSSRIAVIVQQMIESEVSGVLFTANPLTGNREEMTASSAWGLGEGLVSGALDADSYLLDKHGNLLKSDLAEKRQFLSPAPRGGTILTDVPAMKHGAETLTESQLKSLHELGLKVQKLKGMPMDIEFAVRRGEIILLQARPITNLKPCDEPKRDNFNIWDNSNIVESYAGVTTPLTFSFIRKAYFSVYRQFCETIGVDRATIFKNKAVLENMLGLIEGRVYYNLLNWYRLISLMPGFQHNKSFMEQMMGVQVSADFVPPHRGKDNLLRLFRVGFDMICAHISLPKRIEEFHRHFREVYSRYTGLDLDTLTGAQILAIYRTLEEEVLWKWKAPITNDFEAMIFYGRLKKLTCEWLGDDAGNLQNDLLCGEGGIRSTRITRDLILIAQEIEKSKKLKAPFLKATPAEALGLLHDSSDFRDIWKEFSRYLDEYGVRSIEEMKLESVPIKENPSFCITMIQNYLRNGVPDPEAQERREKGIRQNAEKALKERLKGQRLFLVLSKWWIYKWVLKNARNAIKNRENQRFVRAEAYHLVRSLFRAIGKNWQKRGILEKEEDVFYLEMEEIWDFIGGTSTCISLKELTRLRKKEFAQYLLSRPDDRIETYGEVYTSSPPLAGGGGTTEGARPSSPPSPPNILHGLGCCQGTVEGKVKVVLKPGADLRLNGEIMVARQTDPGWVVLFPSISGLIVEKGSMLSHSAIVAREMGIPAVVGVKNATTLLSTGDRVRLDGARGTIAIVEKAAGDTRSESAS